MGALRISTTILAGKIRGESCVVRAGAVVKQRSQFPAGTEIDGHPASAVGRVTKPPQTPSWALSRDDLPGPVSGWSDAR